MLAVASVSAHGQLRFGVTAGGNDIALGLTSTSRSSGYGVSAGLCADWTFSADLPVLFRAEVDWSVSREDRSLLYDTIAYEEDRTSKFISVPMMLGYGFCGNRLRVMIGEEFSYAYSVVSHKVGSKHFANDMYEDFDSTDRWAKGDYNPWRTSLVLGVEYLVLPALGIKVKLLQTLGQMTDSFQDDVSLAQVGVNLYFN